jgi:hypothetical protein
VHVHFEVVLPLAFKLANAAHVDLVFAAVEGLVHV